MPNPQGAGTTFQYNTDREKANAQSEYTSLVGKGEAGGSEKTRDDRQKVVDGVKATLIRRMQAANGVSADSALRVYAAVNKKEACYNQELAAISSSEKRKKELTEHISKLKTEKENLKNSEEYKTNKSNWISSRGAYFDKEEAVSIEENMRQKKAALSDKETFASAHLNALAGLRKQIDSSKGDSKKKRQQTEELFQQSWKDWENELTEIDTERTAIQDYKKADDRHLTEEYYQNALHERDMANEQFKAAAKSRNLDKAKKLKLAELIRQDSDELSTVEKEQSDRKSALLDAAIEDHRSLTSALTEHQADSLASSIQYDKAAMQYYVLTRGNDAKSKDTRHAKITGAKKHIAKYVGSPVSPFDLVNQLENIKKNPEESHKVVIKDVTDAAHPAENHITYDQLISLTEGDETFLMDSHYKIQAASGKSIKLKKKKNLNINQTDNSGQYVDTAQTLITETIATGRIGHKEEFNGLWIDGEFVPANGPSSESLTDIRKSYQKKMQAGGDFDKDRALTLAIRNSAFFRHIYAENIDFYARYPGDDDEITAVTLDAPVPSGRHHHSGQHLENRFKKVTEDKKAVILFEQRNHRSLFNTLVGSLAGAPKNRVIAKLVHAMLVADKDRTNAIEIAKEHGTDNIKKCAAKATQQNFEFLQYACESVIRGNDVSSFKAGFIRGASAVGDFLDGDGPFKGTVAEGLVNYDQLNEYYEGLNTAYGFASGKIQEIGKLEKDMKGLDESSDEYKSLLSRKEDVERDLNHGVGGDVLGIVNSIKDLFFSFKNVWDMIKDKRFLSEEHADEKDLGSLYVSFVDYFFDVGNILLSPLAALLDLLTNDSVGVSAAEPVANYVGIIVDIFHTVESGYHLFQNSRKFHKISKTIDTISSGRIKEGNQTINVSKASEANPQVIYLLERSRNKTGKDIADDSIDVTTGAAKSAGHFTGTVGSKIINITSTAVSTLGKLISNGVYQGKEKTAALKAAFGDQQYAKYRKNPNFDRILKMTAGINSLKHLATVARIFAAIDTHYMLRQADANSHEFKLAKTAMSAFYRPKAAQNGKAGYDELPLSAILGHVGEGDDWRSKLLAAVR